MITIADSPNSQACSTCWRPLTWLYSARRGAWIAFVPVAAPDAEHAIAPHPCTNSIDPPTWRNLGNGTPPNGDYLTAKAALSPPKPRPERRADPLAELRAITPDAPVPPTTEPAEEVTD